jgi:Ca-activated chloride channel family protein
VSFAQPLLLVVLLCVPALLAFYLWQLRRRRRQAVRHSDVSLVRLAAGPRHRWRRHLPIGLVLASLALLGVAAARPVVRAQVPISGSTFILALDLSGSMCATDVSPNRLSAAQGAVRSFAEAQPADTKIGLVLFSGFAQLAVAPTTDRRDLLAALDDVQIGRGTAIGAAILKSVDAIAEIDPTVAPSDAVPGDGTLVLPGEPQGSATAPSDGSGSAPGAPSVSGAPQSPVPEIVVLLTDGANTRGVTPEVAAAQAGDRGVRIYPIGFGTRNPTRLACTVDQYGGYEPSFTGPDQGGPGSGIDQSFLLVDEPTLRAVAKRTGGQYFPARDANELNHVLTGLPKHVSLQFQEVDLSAGFALAAALLVVAGLVVSLRRSPLL